MTAAERAAIGLAGAFLVGPFIPSVKRGFLPVGVTATLCAWALFPAGWAIEPALVAVGVTVVVAFVVITADDRERERAEHVSLAPAAFVVLVGAFALAAAAAVDVSAIQSALRRVARSDDGLVGTLGVLVALFPAGALIGLLTRRWSDAIEAKLRKDGDTLVRGLEGAGRYIGWLERTVIFFALLFGHVEAAALVLTAKSIARFPSFSDEGFAEYFLIGTLLSVVCGGVSAICARLLLGLPAL